MSFVNVRSAVIEDIPSLLPLLYELFSIEEDFVFNEDKQRAGLEVMIVSPGAIIMVAETDGEIVGMATGQTIISTAEGGLALLIEDVIVTENYRRSGIAGRLLLAVGDWGKIKGAQRMQLLADKHNAPALNFYKNTKWMETALICFRKYN